MGKLALVAKITHVPSMYLSELPGKNHGCRQAAIDGHKEISRRMREAGVDTVVVFDTHWLVNSGFHVNSGEHFKGIFTSHELPHFVKDMEYEHFGNPVLGDLIVKKAIDKGIRAFSHHIDSLTLEYGTLVPMRYMNSDNAFKVVSVSALCTSHELADSRTLGESVRDAIEDYDGTVGVLASGSLSHRFAYDRIAEKCFSSYTRGFDREVDEKVVDMWKRGEWKEFCEMLPEYSLACFGEGFMHDTSMMLGVLGGENYKGKAEFVTELFASSGTGQVNAIMPLD